jgi:hypothetical protein
MNKNSIREPAVYGLFHDGRLFYVGQTSVNIEERMWQHSYRARSGHSAPVYEYIRSVGIDNVKIEIIKAINPSDDVKKIEAEIIKTSIESGLDLKNQIARDGNINSMSDESKEKIGNKNSGKKTWITGLKGEQAGWTEERRAKQSERKKSERIKKHGTQSERKKYGCDCDACISWEVEYYTDMESRKAKNQHGTVAGYKHGKCRCDSCRAAYSSYQKGLLKIM